MNKINRLIILSLILSTKISYAEIASGTDGDISWQISDTGILSISGMGEMPNYGDTTPWSGYNESVTGVVINEGITSVGKNAFLGLNHASNLNLPSTLTNIGYQAFHGMGITGNINIPNTVTTLGAGAYARMPNITGELIIPDSITAIPDGAFFWTRGITSIVIPNSVTTIGGWSFNGLKNVTNLTIPDSVTEIGTTAFQDMKGLTNLTIGDSVGTIGVKAFSGVQITELKISDANLQKYLDAGGAFNTENFTIKCTKGDCSRILLIYDQEHNTNYAKQGKIEQKNADGSISISKNGRLIGLRGKRIYTVQEAEMLSKPSKNRFKIRYK